MFELNKAYISRKFCVLYFFAALAVVLIHSGIMAGIEDRSAWCKCAVDIYTQRFTCWAVPFFFLAAGYWFSQGGYMHGKQSYFAFIKSKGRSLVVPYFSFILIALVVSLPAIIFANIMAGRSILANTVFAEPTVFDMINQIFALTIPEPKPLGVMWFIRTLFFLFLLAPVYRFIARRCVIAFPIGVLLFCYFIPGQDIPFFPMWFGAAIWFFLGIWLGSVRGGGLLGVKAPVWIPIVLLAVGSLWAFKVLGINEFIVKLSFILGVWLIYDHINPYLPTKLPMWVSWSFWLYCTHNMIVLYAISGGKAVLGQSDVAMLTLPAIVFIIVTILCLCLASFLENNSPRFFSVLMGGGRAGC